MSHELFPSAVVAALAGLPPGSLKNLATNRIIRPAVRSTGRGQSSLYSVEQVLGLAVLVNSRKRGAALPAALDAAKFLGRTPLQELREQFATGRRFLLLVNRMYPGGLLFRETVEANEFADFEAAQRAAMPVVVIDVQLALEAVEKALDRLRAPDKVEVPA